MNGKRFAWQGVVKLPFINERKLLAETKKLEDTLTEEEQARNSVMCDLLYVHANHPLASYFTKLYHLHPKYHKTPVPIDPQASGGMNGFFWLSERNFFKSVYPSPINGLGYVANNLVINVAYLNPPRHQHIPEPPHGVMIPPKVINRSDIKPSPILWHDDNSSRRQQARDRPQVSRAISGPHLGEASHRLLRNTLQMKPSTSGSFDQPYNRYHVPKNHTVNRPRPAGPSGYEGGYTQDANYYNGNHNNPRGVINNSRPAPPYNNGMWNGQNYTMQDQSQYHDHYNLLAGMSSLKIDERSSYPPPMMQPQMPSAPYLPTVQQMPGQYVGQSPVPPTTWFDKPVYGNPGFYPPQQGAVPHSGYEKQAMSYQVKKDPLETFDADYRKRRL